MGRAGFTLARGDRRLLGTRGPSCRAAPAVARDPPLPTRLFPQRGEKGLEAQGPVSLRGPLTLLTVCLEEQSVTPVFGTAEPALAYESLPLAR